MSLHQPNVRSVIHHFQKISSTYKNPETLERLMQQERLMSHTLNLGPAFYMILDYTQYCYQYVSNSFTDILGYDVSYPLEKKFDFVGEIIHPNDGQDMVQLWEVILAHCKTMPVPILQESAYTVDVRLHHADGHYCHMLQQTISLKTDERGNLQYELIRVTDITYWNKQSPMSGILLTPEPKYNLLCCPREHVKVVGELFSNAELRVLEELAQGKRSKEIAQQLGRSVHTVDTHRRRMLRKTNSHNTQELLRFAHLTGVL